MWMRYNNRKNKVKPLLQFRITMKRYKNITQTRGGKGKEFAEGEWAILKLKFITAMEGT